MRRPLALAVAAATSAYAAAPTRCDLVSQASASKCLDLALLDGSTLRVPSNTTRIPSTALNLCGIPGSTPPPTDIVYIVDQSTSMRPNLILPGAEDTSGLVRVQPNGPNLARNHRFPWFHGFGCRRRDHRRDTCGKLLRGRRPLFGAGIDDPTGRPLPSRHGTEFIRRRGPVQWLDPPDPDTHDFSCDASRSETAGRRIEHQFPERNQLRSTDDLGPDPAERRNFESGLGDPGLAVTGQGDHPAFRWPPNDWGLGERPEGRDNGFERTRKSRHLDHRITQHPSRLRDLHGNRRHRGERTADDFHADKRSLLPDPSVHARQPGHGDQEDPGHADQAGHPRNLHPHQPHQRADRQSGRIRRRRQFVQDADGLAGFAGSGHQQLEPVAQGRGEDDFCQVDHRGLGRPRCGPRFPVGLAPDPAMCSADLAQLETRSIGSSLCGGLLGPRCSDYPPDNSRRLRGAAHLAADLGVVGSGKLASPGSSRNPAGVRRNLFRQYRLAAPKPNGLRPARSGGAFRPRLGHTDRIFPDAPRPARHRIGHACAAPPRSTRPSP
jgi:hypothetical protein